MSARPLDLVVFGATGFTGSLVAEYLDEHAPPTLRWAVAGRDPERLEALRLRLRSSPEIRVADVTDAASIERLAAETAVLTSTVGPFARYGEPVVRACAAAGTHYLDITGEPAFVRRSREIADETARATGAMIVHCCGFDSIPADLGCLFTVSQLPGAGPKTVHATVQVSGSPSGGTWASVLEGFGTPAPRRRAGPRTPKTPRKPTPALRWSPEVQRWAVRLPVIDPVIVGRSARALPEQYGADFTYHHLLAVSGLGRAASLGLGVGALATVARSSVARRWLSKLRPSGSGPDAETRAQSWFKLTFAASSAEGRVVCEVRGGDPGYTETSKMLAECALLVAMERPAIGGGVHTPAVAFGLPGVSRLQAAGLHFEVVEKVLSA